MLSAKHKLFLYPLVITVVVFLAFFPSLDNAFVNWDDPVYLEGNPTIQSLSPANIKMMFTGFVNGNYHPLTMFTFALEHSWAGFNPKIYHLTNLLLHLANVNLAFIFIFLMTGNLFVAGLTALLFGIHPMRVESVAWVTERKDVLFVFFYLAGLILYQRYLSSALSQKRLIFYSIIMILFILSVLSKPSAVTFPLALLLLDYWGARKFDKYVLLEKIPFFIISAFFVFIAFYANATPFTSHLPPPLQFHFTERILLVGHAIGLYLTKLIWPFKLSAYYSYPGKINGHLPVYCYFSAFIVFLIIFSAFRYVHKYNCLLYTSPSPRD